METRSRKNGAAVRLSSSTAHLIYFSDHLYHFPWFSVASFSVRVKADRTMERAEPNERKAVGVVHNDLMKYMFRW